MGLSQSSSEAPTRVCKGQYDSTSGSSPEDEANGDTIHVLHEINTDVEKHVSVGSADPAFSIFYFFFCEGGRGLFIRLITKLTPFPTDIGSIGRKTILEGFFLLQIRSKS